MNVPSQSFRRLAFLLAAAAGLAVLHPTLAQAQVRVMVNQRAGGDFGGPGLVSKRNIERYAEVLGFTQEQKESALTIHEGYAASYKQAQTVRRSAIQEVQRSSEDSGDRSVFMEKFPAIEKEFGDKTSKLEKGLFDDLKSLASGASQEDKWSKVERMRRREVGLRQSALSGEAVDLVDVVGGLKLPPEAMTPLSAPLDEYEVDLDHQLQDRSKLSSDQPAFVPGKPLDLEKLQKGMADAREAGLKIKDVNDRFARKIEPMLPEDKRAAFHDAVRERSFPQVYRPSRAARSIDNALKLDDLSPAQRESLNTLKNSYRRDAKPVNDAWASAIEATEKDGQNGGAMSSAGSNIVLNMQDDPPALANARKSRRELDEKATDKLKGILSEPQQAKLKTKEDAAAAEDGEVVGGDAIMIRTGH